MLRHGFEGSRIYHTWEGMKQRCLNPRSKVYKYYGGRGVKIHPPWFDFKIFKDWALKNGYRDNLFIDRINPNGNYFPSNCRWADRFVQQNNRRITKRYCAFGKTLTIPEWVKTGIFGGSQQALYLRIKKGWKIMDALTLPRNHRGAVLCAGNLQKRQNSRPKSV